MEHALFETILVLLALGALLVALCIRLGVSPILGYLATGLLAGPHGFDWLPDSPATRFMAETGVVLLMFTIGLEFSLPRLLSNRRLVLGLGGSQILVTGLLFGGLAWLLGLSPQAAFVVGAALAMSSTAIALKQLGEQMELGTPHGQAAVGILLAQDLAAVPLLAVIPALAGGEGGLALAVSLPLVKAVVLALVLMTLGRRLLGPLLHWVAGTHSLEMFMLAALLLVMGTAGLAHLAGLSPALGAFLAGMLLGETEFRHQMEADIRPFRDLMLGLFFATIGMQLDLQVVAAQWPRVLLVLAVLLAAKVLVIRLLARRFGLAADEAWRAGISLGEAGEFGLLLLSLGLGMALLPQGPAQVLFAAMILSMALAPLLVRHNGSLAARLTGTRSAELAVEESVAARGGEFDGHVLVCGYGRLGQNLVAILQERGIDCLALDLDIRRVREALDAGEPVVFGDATNPRVLEAAGLERARALAITFRDAETALRLVAQARALRREMPLLARCRDARYEERLREAGAEVFPEGLETSLTFAAQLLALLEVPASEVDHLMADLRARDYAPLRAFFHAVDETGSEADGYRTRRHSLVIGEDHPWVGRSLEELRREAGEGLAIDRVMRAGVRLRGDAADIRLRPGDVLVLRGDLPSLEAAEKGDQPPAGRALSFREPNR